MLELPLFCPQTCGRGTEMVIDSDKGVQVLNEAKGIGVLVLVDHKSEVLFRDMILIVLNLLCVTAPVHEITSRFD